MARAPSEADRDLALRLRSLDIDATPERIQTLREVGLLLAPERVYPGGGGSGGRYPPEAISRAREALILAQQHSHELHMAVVIMYARGEHRIPGAKLKRALLRALRNYREMLLRGQTDDLESRSPEEIAVVAGRRLGKQLKRDKGFSQARRRIPRSPERSKEEFLQMLSTSLVQTSLTGSTPEAEAIEGLFRIVGAHETFGESVASELAERAPIEDLARFSPDDMTAAVAQATEEQLEAARDDALDRETAMRTLFTRLRNLPVTKGNVPLELPTDVEMTVMGALTNLVAMFNDPDAYEAEMAQVRRDTVRFGAANRYAEFLPSEFKDSIFMTPEQENAAFTSGQRQRLAQLKTEFSREYPTDAHVLQLK